MAASAGGAAVEQSGGRPPSKTVGPVEIRLDVVGQYIELECGGYSSARGQVELISGAYTGAVLTMQGSAGMDSSAPFYTLTITQSSNGITSKADVAGLARVRLTVTTASGTAGSLAQLRLTAAGIA